MHPFKLVAGILSALFSLGALYVASTALIEPVREWVGVNPEVKPEDVVAGLLFVLASLGLGRISFHLFTDR